MTKNFNLHGDSKTFNTVYPILIVGIIIVLLGVSLNFFFIRAINDLVFEHRIKPLVIHMQEHAKNHLITNDRIEHWPDEESLYHLEELYKDVVSGQEVVKMNVFNSRQTLIFSSNSEEIGIISGQDDISKALTGEVVYSKPSADEFIQDGLANILEIYIPIKSAEQTRGVLEIYFDQTHLMMLISQLQLRIMIFILPSLILISVILYIVFGRQNAHIKIQTKTLFNIINNSPIGIYTVDKQGIITSFNPKMCKISGCKDPKERIGLNVFELHSYKENNLDKYFRQGLEGEPFETEVRHVSQSQKESFRHYHGVPLFDYRNKDVAELLLLVEDVTERKKLETQLQKYTQSLEITVTARTRELEEKIKEMTRLNDLTVDRELKMLELKKEIEELKNKIK